MQILCIFQLAKEHPNLHTLPNNGLYCFSKFYVSDRVYACDATIGIRSTRRYNFTTTICPNIRKTCATGRLPAIPTLLGVLSM